MTQKPAIKKQFIAGAKCPACNEQDVLVFYRENENPVRECVECGFKEILLDENESENNLQINIKNI